MKLVVQMAAVPLVLLAVYVGLFGYWWLSARRTVAVVGGQRHVSVEMHESSFMSYTHPIWKPAFWFVEHVGGYRNVGYIAAMEDSVSVYEK